MGSIIGDGNRCIGADGDVVTDFAGTERVAIDINGNGRLDPEDAEVIINVKDRVVCGQVDEADFAQVASSFGLASGAPARSSNSVALSGALWRVQMSYDAARNRTHLASRAVVGSLAMLPRAKINVPKLKKGISLESRVQVGVLTTNWVVASFIIDEAVEFDGVRITKFDPAKIKVGLISESVAEDVRAGKKKIDQLSASDKQLVPLASITKVL